VVVFDTLPCLKMVDEIRRTRRPDLVGARTAAHDNTGAANSLPRAIPLFFPSLRALASGILSQGIVIGNQLCAPKSATSWRPPRSWPSRFLFQIKSIPGSQAMPAHNGLFICLATLRTECANLQQDYDLKTSVGPQYSGCFKTGRPHFQDRGQRFASFST